MTDRTRQPEVHGGLRPEKPPAATIRRPCQIEAASELTVIFISFFICRCPELTMSQESFRERLAWLRRMPNHWRLLIGSQVVFTAFAIRYRHILVEKRRKDLLREKNPSEAGTA
jgi:hypothetical protein